MKSNILQFRYLCDGKIRHAGWPLSVKRKFIWIRTFCFFLFVCFVIIICLGSGDIQWLVCHCHKSYFFCLVGGTLCHVAHHRSTLTVCVCRCRSVAWHTTFVHRVRKTTSEKMQNAFGFGFRANASQSDGLFMWVSECVAKTILNFNIFGICLVPFHWSRMLTYRIRHTHKYKQMKSFCAWLDTFKIGKVLNIYFPFEWPESRRCSATRWPAGFSIGWKILMAILLRIFELCRERERENSKAMGNNFSVATFDFGVYMRYIHAVAAKYVWRGLRNLLVGLAYVGR